MSPTVLVADDSRTIRKVVEWALKGSAFEVVGVGSAQETMEAAKQQPSVILLDYHMPDGSGYEVCRALKDGPTGQIPVVMLGGNYHDFDANKARESGADEVVMKPFKTDALIDAIDTVSRAAADAAAASELGGQAPESDGPGAPPPQPSGAGSSQPTPGSAQQPGAAAPGAGSPAGGDVSAGEPAGGGGTPAGGTETPGSAPSRHPSGAGGGSRPRMRMDESSGPKSPPPRRGGSSGGSQPRMRTPSSGTDQKPSGGGDAGGESRRPSGGSQPGPGSQPRIPGSGSQPRAGSGAGSGPKASQPDVNASTREQQVSAGSGAGSAPSAGSGDSGVSSVGASRAEIETMINETVRKSVKDQLPGLLRNIMGEVFQKKVLPKLLEHGQQRVEALVQNELDERIRVCVREEIERLLAEE